MSGGSMDYLYAKVDDARFVTNTTERRAFIRHLRLVAEALRMIEWVDSGDASPGDENKAIEACLAKADLLEAAVANARAAHAELLYALKTWGGK